MQAESLKTQLMKTSVLERRIRRVCLVGAQVLLTNISEVVEVEFDENKINYERLVKYFFDHHDSTQPHKIQYRSVILAVDNKQAEIANKVLDQIKVGSSLSLLTISGIRCRSRRKMSKHVSKCWGCFIQQSITTRNIGSGVNMASSDNSTYLTKKLLSLRWLQS